MAPGSALIPRLMDLSPGAEALRYCFALSAHPESVAGARRLTRARLADWRLSGDAHDAAVLIVSELVTNAVVHTASARVVCELRCDDGRLAHSRAGPGASARRPPAVPHRRRASTGAGCCSSTP